MRSLTWFEDAEADFEPQMLQAITWTHVRHEIKRVVEQFMEGL